MKLRSLLIHLRDQILKLIQYLENILKFDEFWNMLQIELKQEKQFTTLKQNKKFNAHFERNMNGNLIVRVILEHGEPRGQIPHNEFEGIWDNSKGRSRETRFVNDGGRLGSYPKKKGGIGESMNVSYITKLIDHIVQNQDME